MKPGNLHHSLEQGPEQQQPDHRLHQGHAHEPRLSPQLAQVADRHVSRLAYQRHLVVTSASISAASNVRPVCLR